MNVLITSVGRRAYMVKYFKEALGTGGLVHVCNSDDKTIAFHYADKSFISPLIYDEKYISFLIDYCKDNHIDILISLFDIDLLVLAQSKTHFDEIGTRLIVSDVKLIEICNDKWKTFLYLKKNGFHVPKTYLSLHDTTIALHNDELQYPIVMKPRFGCGSIALEIVEDDMALQFFYQRNTQLIKNSYLKYESISVDEKIIFQECLGGQEYGADIINDLNGNFINAIVRKKIAMRSGETDIAELVNEPVIYDELARLGKLNRHIANMDCDIFLMDDVPYILEMNARFGGGYPFSHMGGCNLPKAIVNWVKGDNVDKKLLQAQSGITGFKELYITQS